ncbi:type II secretion system protein [Microbacterium sp. EF45047]|nr:type II secretion system protein [Microbacterium neungamense]WCM56603.1 type II secretion system protein [Microbacterium sp. EF45047]
MELLIVIVVIAILAVVTIVSYNGIQQRAINSAISNAASQAMRLTQLYVARESRYPALHERGCSAGLNPPGSSSDRAM